MLDRPTISDARYDRLYAELVRLERAHPELVIPDSPAQRVGGAPSDRFAIVRHAAPMLSLEASSSEEDAISLMAGTARTLGKTPAWVLEPKYDGLSVELIYEPELGRWLVALGVPGLGPRAAGVLAKSYRTIDRLAAASKRALAARVGAAVAAHVASFVRDRANRRLLEVIRGRC